MSSNVPTAFVCGATGAQGFAVAKQLHGHSWTIRTISRHLNSPAAQRLKDLDISVTKGNWNDAELLASVITGCSHLFLNVLPGLEGSGSDVPHAKRIIDIAKAKGVNHIVYTGALSSKDFRQENHQNLDNPIAQAQTWKQEIEALVRGAGFETWTILRPGVFMPNFLSPKVNFMYPSIAEKNIWVTSYTPQVKLPLVDMEDVGRFTVASFQDPARFHQQEIDLVSELLAPKELLQQLAEASGRPFRIVYMTESEVKAEKETNVFMEMEAIAAGLEKSVDLENVRSWGFPLGTFREFLAREHAWVRETYS
ncbi:hypothetical protein ACHAPJ_004974 [Fusarium lateritium]